MKPKICSVSMPSPCTQFGSSVEKHTIAARNAFASIGIHIPKIVDEWKTTAWLTESQPYHTTAIDGETSEQARSERPPGRAGFIWWPRLMQSRPGIASGAGRGRRSRSSTFSIQMTLEAGAKYTRASEDVG